MRLPRRIRAASRAQRLAVAVALLWAGERAPWAAPDMTDVIAAVTPGIVGVGTQQPLRKPPSMYRGTGFVVGDGNLCATNAHVLAPDDKSDGLAPGLAVFVPNSGHPETRAARVVLRDADHDLALIRFDGAPLPALKLGDTAEVRAGTAIALTGFPLGAALGLYPTTHIGIVSAITPIAAPAPVSGQLTATRIKLRRDPFSVFQLDATAFPGNSGSPVYEVAGGHVVAVVNQAFVSARKENAIPAPSGITYAIPVTHLLTLLRRAEAGETDQATAR